MTQAVRLGLPPAIQLALDCDYETRLIQITSKLEFHCNLNGGSGSAAANASAGVPLTGRWATVQPGRAPCRTAKSDFRRVMP